jgi:hypothetical protein
MVTFSFETPVVVIVQIGVGRQIGEAAKEYRRVVHHPASALGSIASSS